MESIPSYIKSLLAPTTKKAQGRKVWSIDLETVWLPFFTATNTQGDTSIPAAALGCPLRLSYDKTGAVRFSQAGRPLVKVVKELGDSVRLVRDNLVAQLVNHASHVATENADGYAKTIAMARQAGEPVHQYDRNQLDLAIRRLAAVQAATEADAKAKAEAIAKAEAEAVAKAEAIAMAEAEAKPKGKSKELVHA